MLFGCVDTVRVYYGVSQWGTMVMSRTNHIDPPISRENLHLKQQCLKTRTRYFCAYCTSNNTCAIHRQ